MPSRVSFRASPINTHCSSVLEKCIVGAYRFENTRKHFPDQCKVKDSVKTYFEALLGKWTLSFAN